MYLSIALIVLSSMYTADITYLLYKFFKSEAFRTDLVTVLIARDIVNLGGSVLLLLSTLGFVEMSKFAFTFIFIVMSAITFTVMVLKDKYMKE